MFLWKPWFDSQAPLHDMKYLVTGDRVSCVVNSIKFLLKRLETKFSCESGC